MNSEGKQISMAASAIALRGVRIFLTAGRHGAERPQTQGSVPAPRPKPKGKKPVVGGKPPRKVFEMLIKTTRFTNYTRQEENIVEEVANLSPEVLRKIKQNALKRAQMCVNSGGGHLSDTIFST